MHVIFSKSSKNMETDRIGQFSVFWFIFAFSGSLLQILFNKRNLFTSIVTFTLSTNTDSKSN